MGDQPVTRAEFDGLHMAAKALLDQMVALTSKIGNINNNNRNNRNYDDKNNQNRRGEPIRVRCENNRIIEDSNSSTVEKTDFEEIMSNHWKKLQILREQTDSAKSIEKDQEAKCKVTCEDVTIDTTHGNQAMDFEKESLSEDHKDEERPATVKENNDEYCLKVSTILKEATCSSVSSTIESSISMSVAPTIRKLSQQLDSSSQFLDPDSEIDSDLVVNSGSNSISEINMEIEKPTLLDKQIPTKAFSSFVPQRLGEVKFQSLSPNTIGGTEQSVLLSFNSLRCYDPGGFLVALRSCFQNQTSPSNLQCLSEVKCKPFSSNHLIALPLKPPDVIHTSSLSLPFSITTKGMTSMQFSDEYSFIVLQRVAEATKQAIKRKIVQATYVDFQSWSIPTKPKPSVISGSDIAKLFVPAPPPKPSHPCIFAPTLPPLPKPPDRSYQKILVDFQVTQNFTLPPPLPAPLDTGNRSGKFITTTSVSCAHYMFVEIPLRYSLNFVQDCALKLIVCSDSHRSFDPDISLLFVFLPILISFPCPLCSMLEESLSVGNKEMNNVVILFVALQKYYDTNTLSCLNKHSHFYNLKDIEFENILGDSWLNGLVRHMDTFVERGILVVRHVGSISKTVRAVCLGINLINKSFSQIGLQGAQTCLIYMVKFSNKLEVPNCNSNMITKLYHVHTWSYLIDYFLHGCCYVSTNILYYFNHNARGRGYVLVSKASSNEITSLLPFMKFNKWLVERCYGFKMVYVNMNSSFECFGMSIDDVFITMWLVLGLEFFAAIKVSVGVYIMWNKHVGDLVFVHLTSQSSEEKEDIGTAIEFRSVQKWLDTTSKRNFYAVEFLLFLLATYGLKNWKINLVYEASQSLYLISFCSSVEIHDIVLMNDGKNSELSNNWSLHHHLGYLPVAKSCVSLIDVSLEKESCDDTMVISESPLKEVIGENVVLFLNLELNSLKWQKLNFKRVLQYHENYFKYMIMSECQKHYDVADLHRKMIDRGSIRAPTIILKWKTLPPKHGTWKFAANGDMFVVISDQQDKIKEFEAQDINCKELAYAILEGSQADEGMESQVDSRCLDNASCNQPEELPSCHSYYLSEFCKTEDLENIRHATTFFQWDPGGCRLFIEGVNNEWRALY